MTVLYDDKMGRITKYPKDDREYKKNLINKSTRVYKGSKLNKCSDTLLLKNVPLNSLYYPIILTTKLENMCIMQKKTYHYTKSKDIFDYIDKESKPNKKENSCKCLNTKHKITFFSLLSKLNEINVEIRNKKNDRLQQKNKNYSQLWVVEISSDEDDDVPLHILSKKRKNECTNNNNNKLSSPIVVNDLISRNDNESRNISNSVESYLKKRSITDYNVIIGHLKAVNNLKFISVLEQNSYDVVIVIVNLFLNATDIYITNKNGIVEFNTVQYPDFSLLNKILATKRYKEILWFDCCCWLKRNNEIGTKFKKKKIAMFVSIPHPCLNKCSCCCQTKKSSKLTTEKYKFEALYLQNIKNLQKDLNVHDLVNMALNYNMPPYENKLNLNNAKQIQTTNGLLYMQFKFTGALVKRKSKYNKDTVEQELLIHGFKIPKLIISKAQEECIQLDNNKQVFFHSFGKMYSPGLELHIQNVTGAYPNAICCKLKFSNVFRQMAYMYDLPQNTCKYIKDLNNSNIFKKFVINYVDTCPTCEKESALPAKSSVTKSQLPLQGTTPVLLPIPIEHIRKSTKCLTLKSKVNAIEQNKQLDQILKTMQIMIETVVQKFPNIIFFINDNGMISAGLPLPYNSYPMEDLKVLSPVLEFAQTKVKNLGLPVGTKLNWLKTNTNGNTDYILNVLPDTPSLFLTVTPTTLPNKPIPEEKNKRIEKDNSLKFCSTYMKYSKLFYSKSFDSFTNTSSLNDEMQNSEILLPKICNIFSLNKDAQDAQQTTLMNLFEENESVSLSSNEK